MTKKKRRSCRGRPSHPGGVVLHEFLGGTMQERIAWGRGVVKALGYPCLLCEDPDPCVLGRLVPDPDAEFTGPMAALREDGTLTLWYALCEDCSNLDDAGDRVEARMLADA